MLGLAREPTMSVRMACPNCGQEVELADSAVGQAAACLCGASFTVPAAASAEAQAAPEATAAKPQEPAAKTRWTRMCPVCGAHYPPDIALCVKCGVDLKTGKRMRTVLVKPAPEKPALPALPPAPPTWGDFLAAAVSSEVLSSMVIMSAASIGYTLLFIVLALPLTALVSLVNLPLAVMLQLAALLLCAGGVWRYVFATCEASCHGWPASRMENWPLFRSGACVLFISLYVAVPALIVACSRGSAGAGFDEPLFYYEGTSAFDSSGRVISGAEGLALNERWFAAVLARLAPCAGTLGILGLFLVPMAILSAAAGRGALGAFSPVRVLGWAGSVFVPYLVVLALWLLDGLVFFGLLFIFAGFVLGITLTYGAVGMFVGLAAVALLVATLSLHPTVYLAYMLGLLYRRYEPALSPSGAGAGRRQWLAATLTAAGLAALLALLWPVSGSAQLGGAAAKPSPSAETGPRSSGLAQLGTQPADGESVPGKAARPTRPAAKPAGVPAGKPAAQSGRAAAPEAVPGGASKPAVPPDDRPRAEQGVAEPAPPKPDIADNGGQAAQLPAKDEVPPTPGTKPGLPGADENLKAALQELARTVKQREQTEATFNKAKAAWAQYEAVVDGVRAQLDQASARAKVGVANQAVRDTKEALENELQEGAVKLRDLNREMQRWQLALGKRLEEEKRARQAARLAQADYERQTGKPVDEATSATLAGTEALKKAEAQLRIAKLYLEQNNVAKAREAAQKALQAAPGTATAKEVQEFLKILDAPPVK